MVLGSGNNSFNISYIFLEDQRPLTRRWRGPNLLLLYHSSWGLPTLGGFPTLEPRPSHARPRLRPNPLFVKQKIKQATVRPPLSVVTYTAIMEPHWGRPVLRNHFKRYREAADSNRPLPSEHRETHKLKFISLGSSFTEPPPPRGT